MPEGLGIKKLMKTVWYPQPHEDRVQVGFELDNTSIDQTSIPIIMYDEGLGAPADNETHPRNTSFATVAYPNCYPDSRVNDIYASLEFNLTSKALDDNIPAIVR